MDVWIYLKSVCISSYQLCSCSTKLLLHFLSKLLHLTKVDTSQIWQKGFLMSWVGRYLGVLCWAHKFLDVKL